MTVVHTEYGYAELEYARTEYTAAAVLGAMAAQFRAEIAAATPAAMQFEAHVIDYPRPLSAQERAVIEAQEARAAQLLGSIQAVVASGAQLRGQIVDFVSPLGTQFEGQIRPVSAPGAQVEGVIEPLDVWGAQVEAQILPSQPHGGQFEGHVADFAHPQGSELEGVIEAWHANGASLRSNPMKERGAGAQFEAHVIDSRKGTGAEFYRNTVFHTWEGHAIYAVSDYGVDPYLTPFFRAHLGTKFEAKIDPARVPLGAQFQGTIIKRTANGAQFRGQLVKERGVGAQFVAVQGYAFAAQFRSVYYNTKNLRILWEFPSRGDGNNWTANTTQTGDFSASNLNTDVVEQVWRSAPGVKTGIRLDCDTGLNQGVYLDTLAILNHNLTKSANVTIQGDDDPNFGSPGIVFTLSRVELENTYFISPELPLQGFRYWRITIDDFTNPNNYLQIGAIVFGEATIMTESECFSNPIKFRRTHYADTVETEGFTNVSNDRGVKRSLTLDFRRLNFSGGNYDNLQTIFQTIRTSHKALWIPTPQYPSRYALFGKLTQMPEEEHEDNGENADYVDFSIDIDEAK